MDAKTLALYLGCRVMVKDQLARLTGLRELHSGGWQVTVDICGPENVNIKDIKLLLRPLSSMTIEHKEQIFDFVWPSGLWSIVWSGKIDVISHIFDVLPDFSDLGDRVKNNAMGADHWAKLLNKARELGYDADLLIEKGEAIDSTTLTPTP